MILTVAGHKGGMFLSGSMTGIYSIVNNENGRRYVGSAVDVPSRLYNHRWHLQRGSHRNKKLLNAWRKHGETAFSFEVLEVVSDPKQLLTREQHWIDTHNSAKNGYNLNPIAGSNLGLTWKPESRAKLSQVVRRHFADPRNKKITSKATREGMAHPEVRNKCRRAMLDRLSDDKLRAELLASRLSPEARRRLSESNRQYWQNLPEEKRKYRLEHLRLGTNKSVQRYRAMSPEAKKELYRKRIEILSKVCALGGSSETYRVFYPSGKTEEIKNLKQFCRVHSIPYSSAMNCMKGRVKHARGFIFERMEKC